MNGQADITSHRTNLLQPTAATKCSCHSKTLQICKSPKALTTSLSLNFLTFPDSWAKKIRCTGKHQLQNRNFDDQDESTYCRSAQDELFETTGYFESLCADWQYIDFIMRLLQGKGICGTQIPAEYGPLSRGPAPDHELWRLNVVVVIHGGAHTGSHCS